MERKTKWGLCHQNLRSLPRQPARFSTGACRKDWHPLVAVMCHTLLEDRNLYPCYSPGSWHWRCRHPWESLINFGTPAPHNDPLRLRKLAKWYGTRPRGSPLISDLITYLSMSHTSTWYSARGSGTRSGAMPFCSKHQTPEPCPKTAMRQSSVSGVGIGARSGLFSKLLSNLVLDPMLSHDDDRSARIP